MADLAYYVIQRNDTNNEYIFHTMCPRSSDPFYIVTYYIIWVTTSWTHGKSDAGSLFHVDAGYYYHYYSNEQYE